MSKSIHIFILAIILLLAPVSSMAADFYLIGTNCKMTVGYTSNVKKSEQLKTGEFPAYFGKCTKNSKTVECDFINPETKEVTPTIRLNVLLNSPPYLNLSFNDGAEFITINLASRLFVNTTRIVDTEFLASKTCYGIYMTEKEFEAMGKK